MRLSYLFFGRQRVVKSFAGIVVSSLMLMGQPGAFAGSWLPSTAGEFNWGTSTNWESNALPSTTVDAIFASTVNQSITTTTARNAKEIIFKQTSGTTSFVSEYSYRAYDGNVSVGYNSSGASVLVQSGANLNTLRQFIIGYASDGLTEASNNKVVLTGQGNSTWSQVVSSQALIIGNEANSNNNRFEITGGGLATTGGAIIGQNGSGNNALLSGTNSRWDITSGSFIIGESAQSSNSLLRVEANAAVVSSVALEISNGALRLDGGVVRLNRTSASVKALAIGASGRIEGAGNLIASEVTGIAGAVVDVGYQKFGVLNATADWVNENITLKLAVGNVDGTPIAGTNFDALNLTGRFTFGGTVEIDVQSALLAEDTEIRLISWTSVSGEASDMTVNFVNGNQHGYQIRGDGLYMTAIPEPSTWTLIWGALLFGWGGRRILMRRN